MCPGQKQAAEPTQPTSPGVERLYCCAAGLILADLPIGEPVPFCLGSLGEGLDLHAALIPNPVCTFYMRASGSCPTTIWLRGRAKQVDRS